MIESQIKQSLMMFLLATFRKAEMSVSEANFMLLVMPMSGRRVLHKQLAHGYISSMLI